MSRFLLYSAVALFALTGPTWLGQVAVAEAGYRPSGIDFQPLESALTEDVSGSAGAVAVIPPVNPLPDQNPDPKPPQWFGDQPTRGGAGAPSGASAGGSGGPAVAVLATAAEVDAQTVTRLRVVRDWFPPNLRLSSVFEPPRAACS